MHPGVGRRGTRRSGIDDRETARRAAQVFQEAIGTAAARAAGADGDLMSQSTLSRRISEFLGVALFALALIWLIALVTYEPTDPVWFFTTDALHPPAKFLGRVGAFLSDLSFQLLGYAAYLIPAALAWAGWYYFWCQPFDAIYTKVFGIMLLLACSSAFLSLVFGSADVSGKTFEAGGSIGAWLGAWSAEYLDRKSVV